MASAYARRLASGASSPQKLSIKPPLGSDIYSTQRWTYSSISWVPLYSLSVWPVRLFLRQRRFRGGDQTHGGGGAEVANPGRANLSGDFPCGVPLPKQHAPPMEWAVVGIVDAGRL